MLNDDGNTEIRLSPPVPQVQEGDGVQWMDWILAFENPVSELEPREMEELLGITGHFVQLAKMDERTCRIRVCQSPITNYTALYDACLRALLICEREVGPLSSINGVSRERHWARFVVAKNIWPSE